MTRSTWIVALWALALLPATACGDSPPAEEEVAPVEEPAPAEIPVETPAESTVEPWEYPDTGALEVRGDTNDWFDVTVDGSRATPGVAPLLNNTVELQPGTYQVRVNQSERSVTVAAGEKTVLRTGTLVVEGTEANFWAPYLGDTRLVAANPPTLGSPLALLAGSYRVELNVGQNRQIVLAESVDVRPGITTTLHE